MGFIVSWLCSFYRLVVTLIHILEPFFKILVILFGFCTTVWLLTTKPHLFANHGD